MKKLSFVLFLLLLFFIGSPVRSQGNYKPGLAATGVSSSKVTLNWQNPVSGGFTCDVFLCSGGMLGSVDNRNTFTVSSLDPNTEYSFKIKIKPSKGGTYWTECATTKTLPPRPF